MDSNDVLDAQNQPLLDIGGIIALLWRRKILIAACTFGAIALAMGYLTITQPTYSANAVIVIDPREANATAAPNVLSGIGSDSAAIASQVAIISSTELMAAVFEPYKDDSEFSGVGLIGKLRGQTVSPEAAFENFRKRFSISREGLTYVLNLSFKSGDPEKAARIANDLANKYISGQVSEKSGVSNQVSTQLTQSIGQLRQQVATAEKAVEDYRAQNNLFDTGSGRTLIEIQIDQLNAQLSTAREAARAASNQYDQARAAGTSPQGLDQLTQFLTSGSAEQLRNTYNLRIAELANARASLGPQHPTLVRLDAEVKYLANLMREEAARIIASLKANAELANSNIQRINDELIQLQTQSSMSSQQAVQLRQLERNADASRQVLEQFLARSEQVNQQGQLQRPDARILSQATPPLKASWPRPSLVLGGAGMFGMMLGSMIALFTGGTKPVAQRSATVRQTPELAEPQASQYQAPQPILRQATRPLSPTRQEPVSVPSHTAPSPARPQTALNVLGTIHTRYQRPLHYRPSMEYLDTIRREVLDYPQDDFAEDVNILTQDIMRAMPRHECGMIALSGFGDRLEKTRLTSSLATEMRHMGVQPLVIDLDPLVPATPRHQARGRLARNQPNFHTQTDADTGITIVTADQSDADENERVEDILCDITAPYDVILIISKSIAEPDANFTMFTGAHHNILVLNADEDLNLAENTFAALMSEMAPPQVLTIDYGRQPVFTKPSAQTPKRAGRQPQTQSQNQPQSQAQRQPPQAAPAPTPTHRRQEVSSAVEELRRVVRRAAS